MNGARTHGLRRRTRNEPVASASKHQSRQGQLRSATFTFRRMTGRFRRRLVALAGALSVAALVYFLAPATSFSPEALAHAVAVAAGEESVTVDPCKRRGEAAWTCTLYTNRGSGLAIYDVEMEGRRCWHGRKTPESPEIPRGAGQPSPTEIDGCLKIRNQLRPWDRL